MAGHFRGLRDARLRTAARLSSSVEADAQGSYWAIERLRATLDSVFEVRDLSSASGDQERELHVLLASR